MEAMPHARLNSLIRKGRLCVSASGKIVARLASTHFHRSVLHIGDNQVPGAVFEDGERTQCLPRIIEVAPGGTTLVHGTLSQGKRGTGLFLCHAGGVEQISDCEEIIRTQQAAYGVLVFMRRSTDPPDMQRLIIPCFQHELKIHASATVTPVGDDGSVLIVEPIGGILHRYVVGPNGWEDLFEDPSSRLRPDASVPCLWPMPLARTESFVGLIQWRGTLLLATRGREDSRFQRLGPHDPTVEQRIIPVEGMLEAVWQSPSEHTVVYLSRVRRGSTDVRVLVVNGRIVHQGEFMMGPQDLVWSPDGKVPGVRIREGMDGSGAQVLISLNGGYEIEQGFSVNEFLVDNTGTIAAWIDTDGNRDRVCVHGSYGTDRTPMAWNLSWTGLAVRYNCVLGVIVRNITDQTHVPGY